MALSEKFLHASIISQNKKKNPLAIPFLFFFDSKEFFLDGLAMATERMNERMIVACCEQQWLLSMRII